MNNGSAMMIPASEASADIRAEFPDAEAFIIETVPDKPSLGMAEVVQEMKDIVRACDNLNFVQQGGIRLDNTIIHVGQKIAPLLLGIDDYRAKR